MTPWLAALGVVLSLVVPLHVWARNGNAEPGARKWRGIENRLQELEAAVDGARDHARALGYLHDRFEMRDEETEARSLAQWLNRVANAPVSHPVVRDHARYLLMQLALEQGDLAQAAAQRKALGLLGGYWVLGPFENSGGAGLTVNHGPEDDTTLTRTWDGLSRAVAWRRVDDVGPGGILALHDHLWPSDEVAAYALVFIRSNVEQDAALRVGSTDQLKVMLNGEALLVADELHNVALDQHTVAMRLRAGWNRLLIKVGQLRGGWNLLARLTAPDGSPLPDWEASLDPSVEPQARAAVHAPAQTPAWDPLSEVEARARDPGIPRALALEEVFRLRRALHLDDERVEPLPRILALEAALREAPTDPYLLTAMADEWAPRDVNRARELYQNATTLDANFAPAWLGLGRLRLRQELNTEARELLQRAVNVDRSLTTAAASLHELRFNVSADPNQAVRDMDALVRRRPTVTALETLMMLEQNRGALSRAHQRALKLRSIRPAHRTARHVVMDVARRKGDMNALLVELAAARALDPHNRRLAAEESSTLLSVGRGAEAQALLERFLAQHPDSPDVWEQLGEMRQRSQDVPRAIAAYRESLLIRPQNAALRRHVEALSGEDRFEDRHQLDVARLAEMVPPPGAQAAGGYALGHVIAHRLLESGLSSQVVDMAYRLLDRAKAPLLRELTASYVPGRETFEVLRAERVTAAGEVFEAEIREQDPVGRQMGVYTDVRRVTANFGTLQAGDIVRFRYRVDAVGERNLFGDFFGLIEYAQEQFPKARYELVVEAPTSRPLSYRSVRLPDVTTEVKNGWTVYRLSARDLPALVLEPHMPAYTEVGAYAMFSSYGRWEDLGRWYTNLVREQFVLDDELRAVVGRLVAGVPDDVEKIRRIHRYVLQQTRYVGIELGIHGWKPYRVTQVHARGYGDCKDKAALLVALLKEAGIDARLVLLRTANQGPLVDLPSMWSFNHAIAYIPSRKLFIDGTAEFSGTAELPYQDQDALSLAVDVQSGGVERVTPAVAPSTQNTNNSDYVIEIDADGNARLRGEERFTGQRAPEIRMDYQDRATQRSRLERELSGIYPGTRVGQVEFSDMANLDAPVAYRFDAEIPAFGGSDGEAMLLPITLYPHQLEQEYGSIASRTHDLVLSFPSMTRNRMRFVLPAGMKAENLPQSTRVSTPHFEFTQTITVNPDGYTVDEVTHFKSRRIPAKGYAEFRAALVDADRRMAHKVRVVGEARPPS
ncbi:MAG: DUF3857 domain-containing protein [Myxococcota bacterium]